MHDDRCTEFGVVVFEATMETKEEDINHLNENDRGSYARNVLKSNDKNDGTCELREIVEETDGSDRISTD
eukprot:164845-Heterocapsa_arctica.AAC.1